VQDTLLAAHLLTTSKIFVDKASMDQLCLWSSKQPPEAAILKSPKGGPFWTGEQVFGLTLPAELNMGSPDETILIQGGQITKWIDGTNLLRKDKESIASALCHQLGPLALVDFLNNATGLLHAWLQVQGFSAGLIDFQVTDNSTTRQKMLQSIFEEYYQKSIQESYNSVRIDLDPEAHGAMGSNITLNPECLTKNIRVLEHAAQQIFRTRESHAENIVERYAEKGNPLLLMVKSGSKGSRGKLLQQIAGMGLQLHKGKHLIPLSGIRRRSSMSDDPLLDWWKDKGLVRSSLVDGLKATELFNHIVADRASISRKHIEVTQPGTLFKSLMLFLRDLHVTYDGSVRSQFAKNLVQFCYGGAEGVPRRTVSKKGSNCNQFEMDDPITPAEGDLMWEEDDHKRWLLSRLAGEPVGVLAATAISQPAYEVMLDAPNLNGPFNPRPLELLQVSMSCPAPL
jgi:DNA-directed RNA polymerase beta' subunit